MHVAPVHGALEEAEALASSYSIRLNSNRALWQVKVVLHRYMDHAHRCAKDGEPEPQPLHQQITDRM